MNASDIQNALDRIIKQNRNLDESGLRVLLLASSWENESIESAIKIFKERKDLVLSSLDIVTKKEETNLNNEKKEEQIKENDVVDFVSKADISKIIDEVKVMHEEMPVVAVEKSVTETVIEKVPEPKIEIETDVELNVNNNELVLPPSNKESSLGDLLSSSLKELDKIPDEVFENKRSKGIDLDTAPILVKNDGVTSTEDLKKEAIKNVLEGKNVKPLPKTEIKPEIKKEESLLKNDQSVPVVTKEEKKTEIVSPIKKEELPAQKVDNNSKDSTYSKEERVLIQSAEVPSDHLIPDEETMEKEEKTSLVKAEKETIRKISNKAIEEIPHNLPLKPFDASPHVVAFSDYKEAFHGKEEKNFSIEQVNKKIETSNQSSVSIPSTGNSARPIVRSGGKNVPLSRSEKELVVMASVLLFVILILLSYMYSNGRL